jgi:hypothetical protein
MMLCPEPAFPLVGSVFVKVVHAVHERRLWRGKRPWGRILCEVCPSIYPIQSNQIHCNQTQYNTIQYNAMQYNTCIGMPRSRLFL